MQIEQLAADIGFTQISVSHRESPLVKFVARGVADAYLSPILRGYVERVASQMAGTPLSFMQSNGGLTVASRFHGKGARWPKDS